jgi:hypothetical protein
MGIETATTLLPVGAGVMCEQLAARKVFRPRLARLVRWHERALDAVPGPVGMTVFAIATRNTGSEFLAASVAVCWTSVLRTDALVKFPVVKEHLPCLDSGACPVATRGVAFGFVQQAF